MSEKRNEKHQNQKSSDDAHKPAHHYEIKWPLLYRISIEPKAEDEKRYSDEQLYKRSQLRAAKALNWITGGAAIVGLLGLVYLWGTLNEVRKQYPELLKSANAAKASADLEQFVTEGNNTASVRINDIEQQSNSDFPALRFGNFGKVAAPTLDVSYSVFRVNLASGKEVKIGEEEHFKRSEVLPIGPNDANIIAARFHATGISAHSCQLASGSESFQIRGNFSYCNGFGHLRSEEFCWGTYPIVNQNGTISKVYWDECRNTQETLANLRKANQPCPESKPK